MRANRAASADDYKLQTCFQTVRKTLLDHPNREHLEKPLAYWVLPNDRRLPLAFLGRTISDLLETPFEELSATPGIGQKKIGSLVKLLYRATQDEPPGTPFGMEELTGVAKAKNGNGHDALGQSSPQADSAEDTESTFDPDLVSEAMWREWQETVRRLRLGHESLGRVAPSLYSLPTVIWNTPLDTYTNLSLSEIRQLKTHGEKRVRAVLEVFYQIASILGPVEASDLLHVSLKPKEVHQIESWVAGRLIDEQTLTLDDVRTNLAEPLLRQITTDVGSVVSQLARERLGIDGDPISVRVQSRSMGVTRTRVYQLLDECATVMQVRWQDGRCRLIHLSERFSNIQISERDPAMRLFNRVRNLFFPPRFDPIDG